MIFKKSAVAFCSSSNLPAFLSSSSSPHPCGITSSSSSSPRWPLCRENNPIFARQRCYATVSDKHEPKRSNANNNDPIWPSSQHPTPYEIFDQHKHAPYSKTKFYELVKIYHPDRHRHLSGLPLSHTARLERYRLVVAANQILSDPTKRRAYDLYGSGWGGKQTMENLYRSTDRSWRDVPGNPSMNATWEDWEQWYGEKNGDKKEKQQPVFMSNQLFAGVLCVFVVIGSFSQARRASTNSMNIVEMKEQHHAAISQDLRRRQSEQAALNRHERIESFLQQRDGWALASSPSSHATEASEGK